MPAPDPTPNKIPSLADHIVRYDVRVLLQEAQLDYNQSPSGAPRLLEQKDISARFRTMSRPAIKPHE